MKEEILKEVRKEQKEEQKKLMKKFVVIVLAVGIICTTFGVAAGSYSAKQMIYTPSDNTWKVNNVSDAIDDLKFKKVSNNYSTEETVVGTWIDGKKIYQLTFNTKSPSTTADATVAHLPNNIDKILYLGGFIETSSGHLPIVAYGDSTYNVYTQTRLSEGTITTRLSYSGWCNLPEYITIQYTKTTDSASS